MAALARWAAKQQRESRPLTGGLAFTGEPQTAHHQPAAHWPGTEIRAAVTRRGDPRQWRGAEISAARRQPVNGSRMWLKSQVFCVMPEQVLLLTVPGQPPLSRWIAQLDRKFMLLVWAKFSIVVASGS